LTSYPDKPQVAVGAVIIHQEKVLLILRGNPPSKDFWAIPGGRVELGETLQAAAEREVREETGLAVQADEIIYTFDAIERDEQDRVRYHYVILDLQATPLNPDQPLSPGDDAQDARWFSWEEIEQAVVPISKPTYTLLQKVMTP